MITFGVDIGKSSHYAVAVDKKGISLCSPFAFDNNEDGFNILLTQIDRFQKIDTICIGMEATGHYWLNLYCALLNRNFELHVINPILTDAMRRMSVRKTKTDTVDCKYIADVIRMGDFSDIAIQDSDKQNLKQLCRFRSTLVDETAAIKNRFIAVLDQIFPEYASLFSNIFGKSSMALLIKCQSPAEILNLGKKKLTELLKKHSRGSLGEKKAVQIIEVCKHSFSSNIATKSLCFQIKILIQQIEFIENQIDDIEDEIESIYSRCECYLHTIKGVGVISAATIFAEIGDINNFDDPKKLAAFAGIDPSVKQSGNFTSDKNNMSKRGSVYLRRTLWNCAVVAANDDPALSAFYQKKRAEGKDHMTAIGAVSHKLCNIVFAILRDKKPYIVNI